MAADVGYALSRYHKKDGDHCHQSSLLGKNETPRATTALITQDLLGQSFSQPSNIDDSWELDLDLEVPSGWQKHLDLKSGKVYLQKCSSQISRPATNPVLQDTRNHFNKRPLNIMEEINLDLRLIAPSEAVPDRHSPCTCQSVCTLDAVKSALDRANNKELRKMSIRPATRSSRSPSSSFTSTKATLYARETIYDKTIESQLQEGLLSAAGCPNCMLYVIISEDNPKCPKCFSTVSLPVMKKPRIDLNLRI